MQKSLVSSRVRVGHLQSNSSQPIGELATLKWLGLFVVLELSPCTNIPLIEVPIGPCEVLEVKLVEVLRVYCVVLERIPCTGIPFNDLK